MVETREYFRCTGCCAVIVLAGEDRTHRAARCICDGKYKSMGRVLGTSRVMLVGHREEIPCDARCTSATGPSCNCPCEGKNHGTGLVVKVAIYDSIPRVSPPKPEQAAARAAEWMNARSAVLARLDVVFADVVRHLNSFVSPAGFSRRLDYFGWQREVRAAGRLRTHGGRIRAINKIAADLARRDASLVVGV